MEVALTQIRTFPRSGTVYYRRYRRQLISRHRYGIIYSIEGRRVVVTRIFNLRQDPETDSARLLVSAPAYFFAVSFLIRYV